ncbi:MAG: hypothetical protein ACI8RD_001794 [Bacillariaceae sp.]|jgi:hypothetical protein
MGMPLYQEGTLTPIFEGDMPPKKRTPKSGSNIGAIAGDNNLFPQWLPLTYPVTADDKLSINMYPK